MSEHATPKDPGTPEPPEQPTPSRWLKWLLPLMLLSALAVTFFQGDRSNTGTPIDYSAFYAHVNEGRVERVLFRGQSIRGSFVQPQEIGGRSVTEFRTELPALEDPTLLPLLRSRGVAVAAENTEPSPWSQVLVWLLPWLLIVGVWYWMSRRATKYLSSEGGGLGGLLKPRPKRFEQHVHVDVTFDDVAGSKAAKQDLQEIVDFLGNPERYQRLGGKMPRGVLLVGAPGTGKTLLARAVAGEARVPFFSITASEFIELFVGVGASRVRDLFASAKKAAPAIIFIDEIDAVGRSRGTGLGGGHDEREQTLNQLLAEMDGFDRDDRIVVMAATNRPDVLDPALLRPGRFDRRIVVDLPECQARRAILEVHARGKPLGEDVSLEELAHSTPGFSGADLANLVNEAALHAIRRAAERLEARDFTAAYDKIVLGDPRETRLAPDEKRRVAVHEAGHALVAERTPGAEPLRRVSIIPRGLALGATQQHTNGDRHLVTKSELEAKLRVLLGGYASERLVLGEISSGAESDLRQATSLAERMVAQLGMSDRFGPIYLEHKSEHPFLGARIATASGLSDATVHEIEQEARGLLGDALADATATIAQHRGDLDKLVAALLERETLEQAELAEVLPSGPPSGERRAVAS